MLALLLAQAGRGVPTDRLIDETWGESPPPGARRTLQAYVASLRRALGGDDSPLRGDGAGYVLEADRLEVDLHRFEALAHEGRELAASGDAAMASEALGRALALWADEPFADLPADDVPTLQLERVRLHELRLNALEARIDADLSLGRHRQLVPELESLVAVHPDRESLWSQLMTALHESGRSAEALRAVQRLRRYMGAELGLEPGEEIRRLEHRIASGERLMHEVGPAVCPYKGLAAYQPDDADLFFGRQELVNRLVARLTERRLVAVVGASGTGKSSLVAAGLVAALRAGALPGPPWQITIAKPGEHPGAAVDLRSPGKGERRLVIIDQFEEAFTLCTDAHERRAFFSDLVDAVDTAEAAVHVILVARADFYGSFGSHQMLGALVSEGTLLVGPMSPAELEQAVIRPAEGAGLTVERQLVDAIQEDAAGEPGVLPLVSHALLETWARRDGATLTLAGYLMAGRVAGAVTQTAETTLRGRLDGEQQAVARDLLLRLVEPRADGPDTRRTVPRDELVASAGSAATASAVVDALVGARLLTVDDEGVSLTHEALITQWPTLRGWLDEARQGLVVRRQLTDAAQRWDAGGHDSGDLLRGARLAAVIEWRAGTELPLAPLEAEFLDASAALADRRRRDAEEQARRQRRANRRLRVLVAAVVLAFVVSAVLGAVALRARDRAEAQAEAAIASRLARDVDALRDTDLDLALLLAAEAVAFADRAETRAALLDALGVQPRLRRLVPTRPEPWFGPKISGDGRRAIAAIDDMSAVVVVSLPDGQRVGEPVTIPPFDLPFASPPLAISADGSLAAVQLGDGTVWLLDGDSGQRIGDPLAHGIRPGGLAFSPDGEVLAVASVTGPPDVLTDPGIEAEASLVLFDVATGEVRGPELPMPESFPVAATFSPDGTAVAAVNSASLVRVWDRRSGARISSFLGVDGAAGLAFSRDGELVAVIGEGSTRVFQARTGRLVAGPLAHEPIGASVAFAPDGRLVTGASDGWRIWDLSAGRQEGLAITAGGAVDVIQITGDGEVITANRDGTVIEWSLEALPPIGARLPIPFSGAFSPDAASIVSADPSQPTRPYLFDLETGQEVWRAGPGAFSALVDRIAWAPGGDRVAAVSRAGELAVLQAADGDVSVGPVSLQSLGAGDLSTGQGDSARARVQALRFSPTGSRLGVATATGRVAVIDARSAELLADPVDIGVEVGDIAFDTEDRILIGAADGVVRSFDLDSGDLAELLTLPEPTAIQVLDRDPAGRLTVAGDGGFAGLWDLSGPAQLVAVDAGPSAVRGVAISPDGRWLAATLETGETRLFEISTGRPAGSLGEQRSVVAWPHPLAFDPTGDRLYAWDNESYVEWTFDTSDWQAAACAIAGRALSSAERSRFLIEPAADPVCSP